jgi:hypothetical protein
MMFTHVFTHVNIQNQETIILLIISKSLKYLHYVSYSGDEKIPRYRTLSYYIFKITKL